MSHSCITHRFWYLHQYMNATSSWPRHCHTQCCWIRTLCRSGHTSASPARFFHSCSRRGYISFCSITRFSLFCTLHILLLCLAVFLPTTGCAQPSLKPVRRRAWSCICPSSSCAGITRQWSAVPLITGSFAARSQTLTLMPSLPWDWCKKALKKTHAFAGVHFLIPYYDQNLVAFTRMEGPMVVLRYSERT